MMEREGLYLWETVFALDFSNSKCNIVSQKYDTFRSYFMFLWKIINNKKKRKKIHKEVHFVDEYN